MSDDGIGPPQYFWCVVHHRVESGDGRCPAKNLLGPYASASAAEHALEKIEERNKDWDEADARWTGEQP